MASFDPHPTSITAGSLSSWEYFASYYDLGNWARLDGVLDAADASNAEWHYNNYGAPGQPEDWRIITFNAWEYLASNWDLMDWLANDGNGVNEGDAITAAQHYILHGYNENRELNSFDAEAYLAANQDLIDWLGADGYVGATIHYIESGRFEVLAGLRTHEGTGLNDDPVAVDDIASATEGGAVVTGSVAVNDSDGNDAADTLTYAAAAGQGSVAGLTFHDDGSYEFDPTVSAYEGLNAGQILQIVYNYTVTDPHGASDDATLTITVTGTNDAPVAQAIIGAGTEDSAGISIAPVSSDIDTGDTATYSVNTQPSNGTVTFDGTNFVYVPDANFNGTDSFTYRVTDSAGATSVATATVTVAAVNDAPVAQNAAASASEGGTVVTGSVTATDVDSATLTYALGGAAPAGLTFNADGSFSFDPTVAAYNSMDEGDTQVLALTYTVNDGDGGSDTGALTITVTGTNDAPVAQAVVGAGNEDSAGISIAPVSSDVDAHDTATYSVNSQPSNGTVTFDGTNFVYVPDANFNGTDSFTYRVTDSAGATSVATATVTVAAVNDAPVAADDTVSGFENNDITGQVTATDVDGDTLVYSADDSGADGTVAMNAATGEFTFTPDPNFSGQTSFDYTVDDGNGGSVTRTVTVNVVDVPNILTPGQDIINLVNPLPEAVLGTNDNLNAGDVITGGPEDLLFLSLDNALADTAFAGYELGGLGEFRVTNDSGQAVTFDMSSSDGVQTLTSLNSTADVTFNFANTNSAVNLLAINLTDGVNLTLDIRNDDVAGLADEVNLWVLDSDDDAVDVDTINIDGDVEIVNLFTADPPVSVNDPGEFDTSEVRILDLNTPGAHTLTIDSEEDVIIGDSPTIPGGLSDIENALSASVSTVDASASSGDIALSTEASASGVLILGGSGNDTFETSNTSGDTVLGNDGNDTVRAGNGNNDVFGGAGNDNLTVGSGNDYVEGGAGDDLIDISAGGNDIVHGNGGNDTINAGAGLASSYHEGLYPMMGIDLVDGGDGDDTLNLTGDSGDLNELDGVRNVETINLTGGSYAINVTDGSWFDVDTATDTTVNASGIGGTLLFNGNDGGFGGSATPGGDGPAASLGWFDEGFLSRSITVIGGNNNDTILTGIGDDSVQGNGGNDSIETNDGSDTVDGVAGDNSIRLGGGDDILMASGGQLDGNDLLISGGTGDDTIELVNGPNSTANTTVNADLGDEIQGIQTVRVIDQDSWNDNTVDIDILADYTNLEPFGPTTRSVLTIDGSELDAGETLDVDTSAQDGDGDVVDEDFSIIGGAGHDIFRMGNNLDTGDTIDGGLGNDTIVGKDGYVDTAFTNVSNVEAYRYDNAHTLTIGTEAQQAGIVSVIGSGGDDILNAGGYTVGLNVDGNSGNDSLTTGSGDDTVVGGIGNDTITTNDGNDTVDGGSGDDVLTTGAGNDTIDMGSGNDNVSAGSGNDTIEVSGAELTINDTIDGGTGSDTVLLMNSVVNASVNLDNVTSVENYVIAHDGEDGDPLIPDVDHNTLSFTGGNVNTLNFITIDATNLTDSDDTFTVTLEAGQNDSDYTFLIDGSSTQDILRKQNVGVDNNIFFSGNDGDDTVEINGGDLGSTVAIDGGSGTDTIVSTGGVVTDDGFVFVSGVEILTGTAAAPLIAQLGEEAALAGLEQIVGTVGNDNVLLDPLFDNDLTVDLSDGGNDTFDASASAATMTFEADASDINANDMINGGSGANDLFRLDADNGTADLSNVTGVERFNAVEVLDNDIAMSFTNNTFTDVAGNVITVDGTDLDDTGLILPEGSLTVDASGVGGERHFNVLAGTGNDLIETGSGNDTIDVGEGNDTVNSGAGNDVITNDDGDNLINSGSGNDSITMGDGDNTIMAGSGDDTVEAGAGNNEIWGGDGEDTITVTGAPGSENTITGGGGSDTINAGAGQDFFRIENVSDSVALPGQRDQINNFTSGTDRVVIETQAVAAAVANTFAASPVLAVNAYDNANQVGVNFAGNAANFSDAQGAISITANDGVADYVFQSDINKLWIDVNDDGLLNGLDVQITLDGITSIQSGDVILRDTVAPVFPAETVTISEDRHASTTTPPSPLTGTLDAVDTDGTAVTYTGVAGGTLAAGTWTAVGTYGTLSLDAATGDYTYTINAPAVEALDDLEQVTDQFTITATDNAGLTATNTYTVTVNGADDQPVLAPVTAGEVKEILHSGARTGLALFGTLSATDVDAGDTLTYGAVGGTTAANPNEVMVSGTYGTLFVNLSGAYRYEQDVNAIEALDDGETPTDTFTVTVTDGDDALVTQPFVVTLYGADDQPTLAPVTDGSITELTHTPLTAVTGLSGTLVGADVDAGDTLTYGIVGGAPSPTPNEIELAGTYGTLQVDQTTGAYAYTPDPAKVESLAVGETFTDTFTVTVDDGDHGTVDQTYKVNLTGANDEPVISVAVGDADATTLTESNTPNLTGTDTLTVNDVDTSDTVTASVESVATGGHTANAPNNTALLGMFSITPGPVNADTGDLNNLTWKFDSLTETFGYLDAGEDLELTYTVKVDDGNGGTDTHDVTVTVQGANQAPVISVGSGDSAGATLTETDSPLSANGTLTVNDPDITDTVDSTRTVVQSGTTAGGLTDGAVLSMLTLTPATGLAADPGDTNNLAWSFNSGSEAFDYLDDGENVTLTYAVTSIDVDGGQTDTQNIVITIDGTNDAPVLDASGSGDSDSASLTETDAVITASGTLTAVDKDVSDVVTVTVSNVSTTGPVGGLTPAQLTAMMALTPISPATDPADPSADGNIGWTFTSAAAGTFDYLGAGETLEIVYTIQAADDNTVTDTHDVTITIEGTNDEPVINYVSTSGVSGSESVTFNAWDPDFNYTQAIRLQTALNGDDVLTNDDPTAVPVQNTVFDVQNQTSTVVTDIVAFDGTARSIDGATNPNTGPTPTPRLQVTQGTIGNDTMNAPSSGYDAIYFGFGGDDTITGGLGDDTIAGGLGDDEINLGQGGDDTVIFRSSNGSDTINDFTPGASADVLNFSALVNDGVENGVSGFSGNISPFGTTASAPTNITDRLALVEGIGLLSVDDALEIAALFGGLGDPFSINSGGDAVILSGASGAGTAYIWYIDDANTDGLITSLEVSRIGIIDIGPSSVDIADFYAANFSFDPVA